MRATIAIFATLAMVLVVGTALADDVMFGNTGKDVGISLFDEAVAHDMDKADARGAAAGGLGGQAAIKKGDAVEIRAYLGPGGSDLP